MWKIFISKLTKNRTFSAEYLPESPSTRDKSFTSSTTAKSVTSSTKSFVSSLFVIFNSKYSRSYSSSSQRKRIKEKARTAIISASRCSVFPQKKVTILSSDCTCLQTSLQTGGGTYRGPKNAFRSCIQEVFPMNLLSFHSSYLLFIAAAR